MRVLDANARYSGVSILEAMEKAGKGVADFLLKEFAVKGKRIAILVGTGNNGGDGLVAAWHLRDVCEPTLVLARGPDDFATNEARHNWGRVQSAIAQVDAAHAREVLASADLIVDALLGIGARPGPVREPYRSLIEMIIASGKPIVSVDVPSGLGGDLAVRPAATVTMHDVKEGMNEANSGKITVVDVGFSGEPASLIGPGDFLYYPIPREESHKGQNGRLLVVGGGPFTGAPALAAFGAYGIGADVVHVATPEATAAVVAGYSPNLIVHGLPGRVLGPGDVGAVGDLLKGMDALVIGPGLGDAADTLVAVREILRAAKVPTVIDADGITAVSKDLGLLSGKSIVVTPHAREYEALSGAALPKETEARAHRVRDLAAKHSIIVLLKGKVDLVTDGTQVRHNRTGNAGMTVGGTGDVLAGIVGGLLAKGVAPFPAARMAAFANGHAGDLAFRDKSYGLTATDVAANVPAVLRAFVRA